MRANTWMLTARFGERDGERRVRVPTRVVRGREREVQVIAARAAGNALKTDLLALSHGLTDRDVGRFEVKVERARVVVVPDHDVIGLIAVRAVAERTFVTPGSPA